MINKKMNPPLKTPRSYGQILKAFLRVGSLRNQLAVLLFVAGAAGAILALGLISLVDLWNPFLPTFFVPYRSAVIALSAVLLVCLGYGHWIERRWVEITRITIPTSKLAPGSEPVRIIHLSDFHCTEDDTVEKRLPDLIHPFRPDLILLTGDYLGSLTGTATLERLLKGLHSSHGLFAVLGNHEVWYTPGLDLFTKTPVVLLNNEARRLVVRNASICLFGVQLDDEEKAIPSLKELSSDAINVVLYHYPDFIERVSGMEIDLLLSGHTHGGQIALPFWGAIVTLSKSWKKYERGLYRSGGTSLYVSRGLGSYSGFFPAIRFFSRPEIAVIDLVPE
jgi:predicted MPP superfamily phosphohydrolase